MNYLNWDEKTITDFSEKNITEMYDRGYVFTRIGRGVMHQTRSVRIDLSKFELSSENRRILKKVENIHVNPLEIPSDQFDYAIPKLAKDFYEVKFGPKVMSAQKVKEMITDNVKSNFNMLLIYSNRDTNSEDVGYSICFENIDLLHYSYPFYAIPKSPKDMGLGMMLLAIEYARSKGLKYIYLGSLQRPSDTYKLQFSGLQWFDGKVWQTDLEEAKDILVQTSHA